MTSTLQEVEAKRFLVLLNKVADKTFLHSKL